MLCRGLLIVISLLGVVNLPLVFSTAEECQACQCIAKELIYRISAEKHKDPLDLRNRLDSQGKRYGKVINFKLSEQRIHDLLDGLCTTISKKYEPFRSKDKAIMWSESQQDSTWEIPSQAEKEGRQKELENYCVRLLDDHEDDLTDMLKKEEGDLEDILCRTLRKACPKESDALSDEDRSSGKNEL